MKRILLINLIGLITLFSLIVGQVISLSEETISIEAATTFDLNSDEYFEYGDFLFVGKVSDEGTTKQPQENDHNIPYTFYGVEIIEVLRGDVSNNADVFLLGGITEDGTQIIYEGIELLKKNSYYLFNVSYAGDLSTDSRNEPNSFVIFSKHNFVELPSKNLFNNWIYTDFENYYYEQFNGEENIENSSLATNEISISLLENSLMLVDCEIGPEYCFGDPGDTGYVPPAHTNIEYAKVITVDSITYQDTHDYESYYFKVSFPETGWYSIYTNGLLNTKGRLYDDSTGYPALTSMIYNNGNGRGDDLTYSDQFFISYYAVKNESIIIRIQSETMIDSYTRLWVFSDNYHLSDISDFPTVQDSVSSNRIYLIDNTRFDTLLDESISIWNQLEPVMLSKTTYYHFNNLDVHDVTVLPDGVLGEYAPNSFIRLNDNTLDDYDYNIQLNVMLHEIGHALGLGHINGYEEDYNPSLMWSSIDVNSPVIVPGPVDVALYKHYWGTQ
jgi:hypothetical protein